MPRKLLPGSPGAGDGGLARLGCSRPPGGGRAPRRGRLRRRRQPLHRAGQGMADQQVAERRMGAGAEKDGGSSMALLTLAYIGEDPNGKVMTAAIDRALRGRPSGPTFGPCGAWPSRSSRNSSSEPATPSAMPCTRPSRRMPSGSSRPRATTARGSTPAATAEWATATSTSRTRRWPSSVSGRRPWPASRFPTRPGDCPATLLQIAETVGGRWNYGNPKNGLGGNHAGTAR